MMIYYMDSRNVNYQESNKGKGAEDLECFFPDHVFNLADEDGVKSIKVKEGQSQAIHSFIVSEHLYKHFTWKKDLHL